jgi:hypothetical protein
MHETIYLICASVGGTLLVCQVLLGLLGLGGHHDVGGGDHDLGHDVHDSIQDAHGHSDHPGHDDHAQQSWFVGVLTFRSIVAALTFFGLAGLTSSVNFKHDPQVSLGVALLGGALALFAVAYLMRSLHRLKASLRSLT